ncbi:store-operated calcium entry regulator STIMATE-like [Acipenser oxyrinchus oxyrinchus]|uniref:Store-operated calcium entry regulator STIMATE-like n=1 Tax=Acipenser oxyrinchus oxyrinchus TaxID=40147 RepID=A0AAD8G897_ACIOX|nr:store-operated calcium entry regulator STIMATE-like [Acipenser oxyrinchus oxyrinchus]
MAVYNFKDLFLVRRMFDSSLFVVSTNNATNAKAHGCNNGALMDRFGVLIQGLLAIVAFSTLMLKRFREPKGERRPWRIWFYDTSKQAIGALFIHFANVFLSNLAEEDPCSLYLMNFLLDATLGMLLIWAGVKAISCVVEYKQFTLLTFGEYGDPPQAAAWIGQCALYMLIMVFEKTVISLVLLIPGWTKLQEVLLDSIPNPQLELVLVMLIVPFIVNAIMFWVVDSLLMRKYKNKTTPESPESSKSVEVSTRLVAEESQVLLAAGNDTDPSESEHEGDVIQDPSKIKIMDSSYCQQV